jgi:hypothetical protein
MIDDFPAPYDVQVAADAAVHEQDIRGAVDIPGARDGEQITGAVEFLLSTFLRPAATELGLGPLALRTDDVDAVLGDGTPVATVITDTFELFRAATGRRSADQIRHWLWNGDPTPYLPLFALGPFTLRADDLVE